MSPRTIALACIILFSVRCLAQASQTIRSQDPELNMENQEPSIAVRAPSQQVVEGAISIARLSVPRKAREIYEEAHKEFFREHKYAEAQRKLEQALQLYPAFPEALTLCGLIQLDRKQREPAERSLQAAVRNDPTYGTAYLVLSDLYNRELRFDDALAMSQRAVALIDSWLVQYEMARALIGKHQYGLALDTSDAALRTNRGTLLHVAKAHALIGLGRYSEAAAEFRTYLNYQPAGEGSQDAHDLLRRIQSVMGQ